MPHIGQWYFTLIYTSSNHEKHFVTTCGPYHSKYLCDKMLEARVSRMKENAAMELKTTLTSILAVPSTQVVELEAIFTGDIQP